MTAKEVNRRLVEIRARATLATAGPWKLWNGYKIVNPYGNSDCAVARIGPESADSFSGLVGADGRDIIGREADLEFMAFAREDIPFLLALVEKEAPYDH